MAKFANMRDLKNQTTALIREAEKGNAPGKACGHTQNPSSKKDLEKQERYPISAFDASEITPKAEFKNRSLFS